MHTIEPYYNWRHLYTAEEDERSPFYGRTYDEFNFTQTIYNYYIHPQWDDFGSRTLYLKIIFADYDQHFAVIELIGEWNDAIENDIMTLKREIIDKLIDEGITRFILSGENVLNFHSSDSSYYEEWLEDIESSAGWLVLLNMRVVASGATEEVFTMELLQKTYGGRLTILSDVAAEERRVSSE